MKELELNSDFELTEEEKSNIYDFFIAGVQHHKLKTCINEVEVGDNLSLVLEPSNKYDPNAVRIEFQSLERDESIMIGYVPAKFSPSVNALMTTTDLECVVVVLNRDKKPWEQIKVAIREV